MWVVDGARSISKSSDVTAHLCDPCMYDGEEKSATRFCDDCKEFLCPNCTVSHRGLKITRSHKVLSVSECTTKLVESAEDPRRVFCGCNKNSVVSVYCEDHRDVICHSCEVLKHRNCKTVAISEKCRSNEEENFKVLVQRVNKILDEIDTYEGCRKTDVQTLTKLKEKCANDIKVFRKELDALMDSLEQDSMRTIKTLEAIEQREIERHLPVCVSTKEMLQTDLKLFDDIQRSSIKSDMFAAQVRFERRYKEYEKLMEDVIQETKPPSLKFERNEQLISICVQAKNLGSFTHSADKSRLFTRLRIGNSSHASIKVTNDKSEPSITGCTLLPDGKIVLCDFNNERIKLLSDSFKVEGSLHLNAKPFGTAVVSSNAVVITLPHEQQLQYIQVAPALKTGFTIYLDQKCWGIDVVKNEMFVSCHDNPGYGTIRILDMNGVLKRKIALQYNTPTFVSVSVRSYKIYISDRDSSTVACLQPSGEVLCEYNDRDLEYPRQVCFDEEDNFLVCGGKSENIHLVTAIGSKRYTLPTTADGIKNPRCIVYRHRDNKIIITCPNDDKIYIFNIH